MIEELKHPPNFKGLVLTKKDGRRIYGEPITYKEIKKRTEIAKRKESKLWRSFYDFHVRFALSIIEKLLNSRMEKD